MESPDAGKPSPTAPPHRARRLVLSTAAALGAVILFTPIFAALFGMGSRRAAVLALQLGFLVALGVTGSRPLDAWLGENGLAPLGGVLGRWPAGFLVGLFGLGLYSGILFLVGEREPQRFSDPLVILAKSVKYLPLAFLIGILEDVLFFGLLYHALGRRILPAAFIYAWSHFIHIEKGAAFSAAAWRHGLEALPMMGERLVAAFSRPVEFTGLFVVGAVLCALRRESRSLWFGMGVHGGWYFVRAVGRKFNEDRAGNHEWLFGTDLFYDGVLGWVLLGATGLGGALYFRRRLKRESERG